MYCQYCIFSLLGYTHQFFIFRSWLIIMCYYVLCVSVGESERKRSGCEYGTHTRPNPSGERRGWCGRRRRGRRGSHGWCGGRWAGGTNGHHILGRPHPVHQPEDLLGSTQPRRNVSSASVYFEMSTHTFFPGCTYLCFYFIYIFIYLIFLFYFFVPILELVCLGVEILHC